MSVENTTVTRDLRDLENPTGNVYESIAVIGKRANQIALNVKEELNSKLQEFATSSDNLEEIFENREQIEISRHYERMPKPTLVAIHEFQEGKVYFRNPSEEAGEDK
ncbi:MAG: DNA-directed RNA polymerase subunit omega [Bacteroidetes bacterium]|nr:DNA-directed RNA polymerase subunit omega [Bacteroidota bacterium]